MVFIYGNRQTINNRYYEHANRQVGIELTKRTLEGDYRNIFGCCPHSMGRYSMGMGMPGYNMGMYGFGMPVYDMMGGCYGMGNYGIFPPGGEKVRDFLMSFDIGFTGGNMLGRLINRFTGKGGGTPAYTASTGAGFYSSPMSYASYYPMSYTNYPMSFGSYNSPLLGIGAYRSASSVASSTSTSSASSSSSSASASSSSSTTTTGTRTTRTTTSQTGKSNMGSNPVTKPPSEENIDKAYLPAGAVLGTISKGTVNGSASYIVQITTADGKTETYALKRDNTTGKYTLGAKLSQNNGSSYINQDKLTQALKREFGEGFTLPDGYTATLVGDTLIIKDPSGTTLDADGIKKLKGTDNEEESISDEIIKAGDKDGSNDLDYTEWTNMIISTIHQTEGLEDLEITPAIKEKIEFMAKKVDENPDGKITKEELEAHAQAVIEELQEELIQITGSDVKSNVLTNPDDIMKLADGILDDKPDGKITKEEWNEYREIAKESGFKDPGEFKDKNGDGVITKDEL